VLFGFAVVIACLPLLLLYSLVSIFIICHLDQVLHRLCQLTPIL
jgi:hypothetical protein